MPNSMADIKPARVDVGLAASDEFDDHLAEVHHSIVG